VLREVAELRLHVQKQTRVRLGTRIGPVHLLPPGGRRRGLANGRRQVRSKKLAHSSAKPAREKRKVFLENKFRKNTGSSGSTLKKSIRNIHSGDYLSSGAERLGSRNTPDSVVTPTGGFNASTFAPGFWRSAICLFTRSISTRSFFDSWSLSACLHILWKSCGA